VITSIAHTHLKLVLGAADARLLLLPELLRFDNIRRVDFTWKTFLQSTTQLILCSQIFTSWHININQLKVCLSYWQILQYDNYNTEHNVQ